MMDIQINNCPKEISSSCFSFHHASILAVSSWDHHVYLYDVSANKQLASYSHHAAVLDTTFSRTADHCLYSCGLDESVVVHDITTENQSVIGYHDEPVKCIRHCPTTNSVLSGSWDKTVKIWDERSRAQQNSLQLPDRIFSMDVHDYILVVATANRHIWIYDLRNPSSPWQKRSSSLKYMTRKVACMPNGEGYISSSIEGRVAVDYFDESPEVQSAKYAFRCHRGQDPDGTTTIYPVHSLAFHPVYGTFATGGGDGAVSIWDGSVKKRLRHYPDFSNSVASLSFNCDGRYLAVSSSFTFDEGPQGNESSQIFIKNVLHDAKPKRK